MRGGIVKSGIKERSQLAQRNGGSRGAGGVSISAMVMAAAWRRERGIGGGGETAWRRHQSLRKIGDRWRVAAT